MNKKRTLVKVYFSFANVTIMISPIDALPSRKYPIFMPMIQPVGLDILHDNRGHVISDVRLPW